MIAKRINHKGQCGHAQTPAARRACRKALIAAATQQTQEDTVTEETTPAPRFTVREAPNFEGKTLYRALDTLSGQEYDSSFDRSKMVERVAEMNAGQPFQAAQANRTTSRRDPVGTALGRSSNDRPGDCHYCGLDVSTCDCS